MKRLLVLLIKIYKTVISPIMNLMGARCRFYPSCSNYAVESINEHGVVIGIWLTIKRVSRCHPLHPGGLDPVPRDSKKI